MPTTKTKWSTDPATAAAEINRTLKEEQESPVSLQGVNLEGQRLENLALGYGDNPANCKKLKAKNAIFKNVTAIDSDFAGSDLSGAKFFECDFGFASFANVKLINAIFSACRLEGAEFSGDLSGCTFLDSNLSDAGFKDAKLEGATFELNQVKKATWPKGFKAPTHVKWAARPSVGKAW